MRILFFFSLFFIISCVDRTANSDLELNISEKSDSTIDQRADDNISNVMSQINDRYNSNRFKESGMVEFDIDLSFYGKKRLEGKVTMSTDSKYVRIDKEDGTTIVYDGNEVYLSPASSTDQGVRFDIFTWNYFFALPYKMEDDGTYLKWEASESGLSKFRLTFEHNVGDSPDDWYDIYINEDFLLDHVGYIVTFGGKNLSEAEKNAHAIQYHDYQLSDGIPYATRWTFHNYTNRTIQLNETIGTALISNVNLKELDKDLFKKNSNSRMKPLK